MVRDRDKEFESWGNAILKVGRRWAGKDSARIFTERHSSSSSSKIPFVNLRFRSASSSSSFHLTHNSPVLQHLTPSKSVPLHHPHFLSHHVCNPQTPFALYIRPPPILSTEYSHDHLKNLPLPPPQIFLSHPRHSPRQHHHSQCTLQRPTH